MTKPVALADAASDPFQPPPTLQDAIKAGIIEMQTLSLYDTDAEDGDVAEIVATGFSQTVTLTNQPREVRVPVTRGALHVVGVADGKGGITVGIRTAAGRVIVSDNIAIGEKVEIPVGPF